MKFYELLHSFGEFVNVVFVIEASSLVFGWYDLFYLACVYKSL